LNIITETDSLLLRPASSSMKRIELKKR